MDAHTFPCDGCYNRFDDNDLEYIEERNEYLCQDCLRALDESEVEDNDLEA